MREIYNQTAVCRSAALPLLLRVQEEEEAAHARLPAVDLRAGTPSSPPPAPLPSPQGPKRARRRSRRKKKKKGQGLDVERFAIKEVDKPIIEMPG